MGLTVISPPPNRSALNPTLMTINQSLPGYRYFVDNSFKLFHTAVMRSSSDADQEDTLSTSFQYERDGFECAMTVSWRNENNNETTDYTMFAYSGDRSFGGFMNAHIETCGLTTYKPRDATTGGQASGVSGATLVYYDPPKDLVTITSVAIVARSTDTGTLPIPSTLDARGYPLANDKYTFNKRTVTIGKQKMLEINMELSKPVADLVTFGIYKLPRTPQR